MNRPTEARKRFGSRLKKLRESRRWRQHEVAEMLNYNTDFYRHIEAGRRTPPSTLGAWIDQIYEIPCDLMADLCDEAQRDQTPINEIRENEMLAKHMRIWEPRVIPWMLETEPYARVVFGGNEELIADRMDRQKILMREDPVRLDVVLDEAVLRHPLGTPKEFREQLLHLLNFNVQTAPMNSGYHPGWTGMQIILQFDGQPTLLWREARGIGTIVDAEAEVEEAWETWEDILSAALPLDKSREMIRAIADEFSEGE